MATAAATQMPCLFQGLELPWDLACRRGHLFTIHEEVVPKPFTRPPLQHPVPPPAGLYREASSAAELLENASLRADVLELLAKGSKQQCQAIHWLASAAAQLAVTSTGVELVLAAIELARGEDRVLLVSTLGPVAASLSFSRHGLRVVESLLQKFPSNLLDRLARALAAPVTVARLARQAKGSLILEQALLFLSPAQRRGIVDGVLAELLPLSLHSRGNLVVQAALECAEPSQRRSLLRVLAPNLPWLARSKFGTHVVVRALEADLAPVHRAALLESLPTLALSRHSFPVLEVLADESRDEAVAVLSPGAAQLVASRRGQFVMQLFDLEPAESQ